MKSSSLKFVLAISGLLILNACKTYDGQLEVRQTLEFNEKKNNFIEPGLYDAKLKIDSETSTTLTVAVGSSSKNPKIKFKIPKQEKLPEDNGPFELSAAQTGQPYDIRGDLKTTVTQSDEKMGYESCQYHDYVYDCYYQGGKKHCGYFYKEMRGERCIRYYNRYRDQVIAFDLLISNSKTSLGKFEGSHRSTERIILWKDYRCDRYAHCY